MSHATDIVERVGTMPRKKLLRLVTDFRRGLLGKKSSRGFCFAVCAPLCAYLEAGGIECSLHEGRIEKGDTINHIWIEFPDGFIVDPTADQFTTPDGVAMPPVFIGERPSWYLDL